MGRSKEERKAWADRMQGFAAKVRSMAPEQRENLALRYGTMTAEGHHLSPFNTIYLAMQAGRAYPAVGGFRQWGRVGRVVQKGQTAIGHILVPIGTAKADPLDTDSNRKPQRMRFKHVPVFSLEQTEAMEADYTIETEAATA